MGRYCLDCPHIVKIEFLHLVCLQCSKTEDMILIHKSPKEPCALNKSERDFA